MKEEERLKKEKQDMLGFYDYTVVLTYISLVISVFGMTRALAGDFKVAILCLALSGLCDMFDGKIARTKKDRTEDEKKFGIQIDSLCDVVCFGVFPALICYCLGMDRIPGIIILCLYCVASVIRLGYFNVMEEKRQNETSELRQYYQGPYHLYGDYPSLYLSSAEGLRSELPSGDPCGSGCGRRTFYQ